MIDAKHENADDRRRSLEADPNAPRDLVSPLDFAGGLRAPVLSDDELDELCVVQIAELSR